MIFLVVYLYNLLPFLFTLLTPFFYFFFYKNSYGFGVFYMKINMDNTDYYGLCNITRLIFNVVLGYLLSYYIVFKTIFQF